MRKYLGKVACLTLISFGIVYLAAHVLAAYLSGRWRG